MNVREYLIADRQWKREHRIKHARYMLNQTTDHKETQFWSDILSANEDENERQYRRK